VDWRGERQRFERNGRELYCIVLTSINLDMTMWNGGISSRRAAERCYVDGALGTCEQGAVGTLLTGCSGDVVNRVQWGSCEQGALECCEQGPVGMFCKG
jgi:hypothetical protein